MGTLRSRVLNVAPGPLTIPRRRGICDIVAIRPQYDDKTTVAWCGVVRGRLIAAEPVFLNLSLRAQAVQDTVPTIRRDCTQHQASRTLNHGLN